MVRHIEIKVLDEIVLIDESDYEFVKLLGLSIVRREDLKHVMINTQPYHKQYLHRVLLNVTDSRIIVDHRNNNGLDNRRDNLRKTNKMGNALNMRVNKNKKSGLPKGVYKERGEYKAQIKHGHINRYLGHFKTVEDAERAYKAEQERFWKLHDRELNKSRGEKSSARN